MDTQTTKELLNAPQRGEIILYQTADGRTKIDVKLENETVWLTQAQIAALMGTNVPAISKHISNIYKQGELDKGSTISKMEIVQCEGTRQIRRTVDHYNLDYCCPLKVSEQRDIHPQCCCNGIADDFSEGKPLS